MDDLIEQAQRLIDDIHRRRTMTVRDWTQALVATECAFASSVLGVGSEWTAIRDGDDAGWIGILRRLQSKVPGDSESLVRTPEPARNGADLPRGPGESPSSLF